MSQTNLGWNNILDFCWHNQILNGTKQNICLLSWQKKLIVNIFVQPNFIWSIIKSTKNIGTKQPKFSWNRNKCLFTERQPNVMLRQPNTSLSVKIIIPKIKKKKLNYFNIHASFIEETSHIQQCGGYFRFYFSVSIIGKHCEQYHKLANQKQKWDAPALDQ